MSKLSKKAMLAHEFHSPKEEELDMCPRPPTVVSLAQAERLVLRGMKVSLAIRFSMLDFDCCHISLLIAILPSLLSGQVDMYPGLGFTQQLPPCSYFDLKGFPGYKSTHTYL